MGLTAKDVTRHLRFAWLEYEDHEDAVAFDRAFSSGVLGWRNLFLDLAANGSSGVIDVSNQDVFDQNGTKVAGLLDISYLSRKGNNNEKGLICRPTDTHQAFLEKWIVDPGVDGNTHTLVSGAQATDHADVLVISGHGSSGRVSGHAMPHPQSSGDPNALEVAAAFKKGAQVNTGKLKYLIVATCGNCGFPYARLWVPALTKFSPLHGILGYSQAYPGGDDGAALMVNFANVLQQGPDQTVLQAWKTANENFDWGAVMLSDCATNDTIKKWISKNGLDDPSSTAEVRQFDRSSWPTGIPVDATPPPFDAMFHMIVSGTDTEINTTNNDLIASPELGLIPGQGGSLHITAKGNNKFKDGDKVTVLFYYYREQRAEMDLDALLSFQLTPSQQQRFKKLTDANKRRKATGKVDGFEYTFDDTESNRTVINYTVPVSVRQVYKDQSFRRSRGRFVIDLFPPGVAPESAPPPSLTAPLPKGVIHMHLDGVYLRP